MSKELLEKYVQAVMAAPHSLQLTAAKEPREFWQRHVLDALKLIELLPPASHKKTMKALDVGSGNGVPGLPVAIAVPLWSVDLLDSNSKKCGFIDMFCKFNAIKNVHVLKGRAEELAHSDRRETYDLVFARALGKLPVAIELSVPFIKVGGILIVPHGTSWQDEVSASKKAMKDLGVVLQGSIKYSLDESGQFTALFFEKIASTPDKYPRAIGIPTKRPL